MRALGVAALLVVTLAGFWGATEYVAAELRYAPELGPPWAALGEIHVYVPWAWVEWGRRYGSRAPAIFRKAGAFSTLAAMAGAAVAALAALGRKPSGASQAHGSSRWATTAEMRGAGLLRDAGVVLCQTDNAEFRTTVDRAGGARITATRLGALVCHDGPEHVFCFAPTRSGKGVGLVIPTLLSWPHSALVYDIKKENWALTAGWRRQFSRTWRFEPTATDSVRFNPLLEIRKGLSEVKDTQNVADILVDPTGERETKDHWQTTAHSLLTGAILHVLYAEPDKTLAGVAAFLSDPSRTGVHALKEMLETSHLPGEPHPVVAQAAREMLNKSDNELSGVFSTAMSCLGLYRDPVIARNTAASDFRIADLMNGDAPASLYLVVPPSDLARTRPIIRLMLNQIGRRLTESMEFGGKTAYRHRLLLLLDEFPSLGKLEFFETALAFIAGYGLKAFLIAQSLNQLEKAWARARKINAERSSSAARIGHAATANRTCASLYGARTGTGGCSVLPIAPIAGVVGRNPSLPTIAAGVTSLWRNRAAQRAVVQALVVSALRLTRGVVLLAEDIRGRIWSPPRPNNWRSGSTDHRSRCSRETPYPGSLWRASLRGLCMQRRRAYRQRGPFREIAAPNSYWVHIRRGHDHAACCTRAS